MPAVITNEMVFAALPPRPPESHKGAYGRVLAVCGCPAYRGAAALSVLGALRAGAGVVTLAAGESVIQSIAARVLEATFLPLPDESALASLAETATVCLAGWRVSIAGRNLTTGESWKTVPVAEMAAASPTIWPRD